MIQGVVVDRDQGFQAGAEAGTQAVFRILERQAGLGVEAQFFQRVVVDVGSRLLRRHDVAGRDHLEPFLRA